MAKGYHHLTRDQRCQIYALRARGCSMRLIGKELKKDPSTISLEIRCNKGKRGYRIKQADKKAQVRRSQASCTPKKMTPILVKRINLDP